MVNGIMENTVKHLCLAFVWMITLDKQSTSDKTCRPTLYSTINCTTGSDTHIFHSWMVTLQDFRHRLETEGTPFKAYIFKTYTRKITSTANYSSIGFICIHWILSTDSNLKTTSNASLPLDNIAGKFISKTIRLHLGVQSQRQKLKPPWWA